MCQEKEMDGDNEEKGNHEDDSENEDEAAGDKSDFNSCGRRCSG